MVTLRKLAHAIYRLFLSCKNSNFSLENCLKIVDIFLILDLPRGDDSNEYTQSTFWSKKIRKRGEPLHTPALLYKSCDVVRMGEGRDNFGYILVSQGFYVNDIVIACHKCQNVLSVLSPNCEFIGRNMAVFMI